MIRRLSSRLQAIADRVPKGTVIADIGSDHAMLPIYLIESNRCPRAVAGEVSQGPYEVSLRNVQKAGLQSYIDVRLGDGLAVVQPDEVDCIIIAGMGGATTVNILQNDVAIAQSAELILQPMAQGTVVRQYVLANGWDIVDEALVNDGRKVYEVIVASRKIKCISVKERLVGEEVFVALTSSSPLDWETQLLLGPVNLLRCDPLLYARIDEELERVDRALEEMSHTGPENPMSETKRQFVKRRERLLEARNYVNNRRGNC